MMVEIPIVIFIIRRGSCDDPTSNFSNISTAGSDLRHRHNVRKVTYNYNNKICRDELALFICKYLTCASELM